MRMKNPVELLKEVKKLVFQEETLPAPAYTLADGTSVMITALEVGGIVTLADGTPAPAGEHILADGGSIVVAEGGVITEIKPKPEEEAPAVEVEIETEGPSDIEEMKSRIKKMEDQLAKGEADMSAFQVDYAALKEASAKAQEAVQGLIALVETLIQEPAQEPAATPDNFRKVGVPSKADKVRQYSQFVSQFKIK
jgi:hypothetical protein